MGTSAITTSLRLFTGLAPGGEVRARLEHLLAELRPLAPIAWSPPEKLHITTKFIGDWPEQKLPELQEALRAMEPAGPIAVTVSRFGFLPNPHHPRIFFAAVQGGPELHDLARRIDLTLAAIGCRREERPYVPHITLARIGEQIGENDIAPLRERIAALTNMIDFEFGSFQAVEFHLYRSSPAVYTRLSSYSLVKCA